MIAAERAHCRWDISPANLLYPHARNLRAEQFDTVFVGATAQYSESVIA
jgi:hypothetical protein